MTLKSLLGEGSKILNNRYKNKILILNNVDFMEENIENMVAPYLKFTD